MIASFVGYFADVSLLISMWLLAQKKISALYFDIIGCIIFLIYGIMIKSLPIIIAEIAFIVFAARAIRVWKLNGDTYEQQ